jgi:hypothetical protein
MIKLYIFSVPVDLRAPAYCAGQRVGGQTEQDFLLQQYLMYSNNEQTKNKDYVIAALGCSLDTAILQRYFCYPPYSLKLFNVFNI